MIKITTFFVAVLFVQFAQAGEEPTHMAPVEVRERPFGIWGIYWQVQTGLLNSLLGGALPPKGLVMVTGVVANSPADRAGLQAGDEMVNINGTWVPRMAVREFKKLFYESTSGDKILIRSHNRLTNVQRECTLKLDAGYAWCTPGYYINNYWGVLVRVNDKLRTSFEVQINKERLVVIRWSGQKCVLIERPGVGVEMIMNKAAPRMLPRGAKLLLKENGECECREP